MDSLRILQYLSKWSYVGTQGAYFKKVNNKEKQLEIILFTNDDGYYRYELYSSSGKLYNRSLPFRSKKLCKEDIRKTNNNDIQKIYFAGDGVLFGID